MELAKLEKYKKEFKSFSNKIESLQTYLKRVAERRLHLIRPDVVSQALHISEFDAIFLLSLAEQENLLHRKFLVYTKTEHVQLGEFDDSAAIPSNIYDDYSGKEIYKDNFYVDIVFEVA